MERSPYPYKSLIGTDNEVRFMNLNVTDNDDQPLRCDIIQAKLDGTHVFHALSYVWGSQDTPETMLVGDKHLCKITTSLRRALEDVRAIRWQAKEPARPCWVWADAVCINQADEEERAEQVLLMGRLYRSAAEVFIHTGPPLGDGLTLSHFVRVMRVVAIGHDIRDICAGSDKLEHVTADDEELSSSDGHWSAVISLLCREWISRGWILQEALLSERHPQLLHGTESVGLGELTMAMAVVDAGHRPRTMMHPDVADGPRLKRAFALGVLKASFLTNHGRKPLTLEQLLVFFRGCQCSNPLDTIYCLANLASDWKALQLEVDYHVPTAQLFKRAACRMINVTRSVDILHHVRAHGGPDLPSWVPDWTCSPGGWSLVNEWSAVDSDLDQYEYSAGGSEVAQIVADETTGVLSLQARVIDRVGYLSATLDPSAIINAEACRAWVAENAKHLQPDERYRTQDDVNTAFATTLIAGKLEPWTQAAPDKILHGFRGWQEGLKAYYESDSVRSDALLYADQTRGYWPGRRWSRTTAGRMALMPAEACIGDAVAIIPGLKTPFVLRELDPSGQYRLIGECYVHGIMDGELLASGDLAFEQIMIV